MRPRVFSLPSIIFLFAAIPALAASDTIVRIAQVLPAVQNDTDGDGLSDQAETLLGTAVASADTDGDGIADGDEVHVFLTDPRRTDTDGDGFRDGEEIQRGFSPLLPKKRLAEVDTDADGITDQVEIRLGTRLGNADTDGDGFADGEEIQAGFDPRTSEPRALPKSISIHTKSQRVSYYLDGVKIGDFIASTGKRSTPTPTGNYTISQKAPRAWSRLAGLWMPWWLNFTGPGARPGAYAIHELPEWPGGAKEGARHLGIPVSHGCVRLGIGPAKFLYDWTPVGTPVTIVAD